MDTDSRGAVLFQFWSGELCRGGGPRNPCGFALPWEPARPLSTPDGLADPGRTLDLLEAAARQLEQRYGAMDVAWGAS